jgi:dipicolinate synthase subunit B
MSGNNLENIRIAFAITGSFCSFEKTISHIKELIKLNCEIIPVMSEIAYSTDTRFGRADFFCEQIEKLTGRQIIHTVVQAEQIGPARMADVLVVAPWWAWI